MNAGRLGAMSTEQILLVVTASIAVVALVVALVAIAQLRAARQYDPVPRRDPDDSLLPAVRKSSLSGAELFFRQEGEPEPAKMAALEPDSVRLIEGKVIVAPSSKQVVEATMGQPLVRVSVLAHGLAHAVRPESRDRIRALMRREFTVRRRQRRRVARRAARLHTSESAVRPQLTSIPTDGQAWLGELPATSSVTRRSGER